MYVLTAVSLIHSLEFVVLLSLLGARSRSSPVVEGLLFVGRLQNLEAAHQRVVDAHHGARVVKLSAVVWRGEERDQLPLVEELVAVLDDLMRAADQVDIVALAELRHDVLSKSERDTTVVLTPLIDLFVGVGPEQIAQQSSVGHVGRPHYILDRVDLD